MAYAEPVMEVEYILLPYASMLLDLKSRTHTDPTSSTDVAVMKEVASHHSETKIVGKASKHLSCEKTQIQ